MSGPVIHTDIACASNVPVDADFASGYGEHRKMGPIMVTSWLAAGSQSVDEDANGDHRLHPLHERSSRRLAWRAAPKRSISRERRPADGQGRMFPCRQLIRFASVSVLQHSRRRGRTAVRTRPPRPPGDHSLVTPVRPKPSAAIPVVRDSGLSVADSRRWAATIKCRRCVGSCLAWTGSSSTARARVEVGMDFFAGSLVWCHTPTSTGSSVYETTARVGRQNPERQDPHARYSRSRFTSLTVSPSVLSGLAGCRSSDYSASARLTNDGDRNPSINRLPCNTCERCRPNITHGEHARKRGFE